MARRLISRYNLERGKHYYFARGACHYVVEFARCRLDERSYEVNEFHVFAAPRESEVGMLLELGVDEVESELWHFDNEMEMLAAVAKLSG